VGGIAPARIPIVGDPSGAENRAEIQRITRSVAGDPVLGTPHLTNVSSRGAVLEVPVNADATSNAAQDAVKRLRADTSLPVGGQTSENLDYFAVANDYLPIVVVLVLALSFLVLLLAFRSIVVPLVAIAMNLLSVGAAFGILTLVSQDGVGASILGFQQVDTVEAWIPLFLFSVLFGLSMDYHVFLISRIRERYRRTGDNVDAITWGISSSARLITGAALIMVAVFFGFASGDLVMFQQMGFGLGVAVLLDATLVRGVLVPATMRLLGDWNWYLPKSLNWLPPAWGGGGAAPAPGPGAGAGGGGAPPVPAGGPHRAERVSTASPSRPSSTVTLPSRSVRRSSAPASRSAASVAGTGWPKRLAAPTETSATAGRSRPSSAGRPASAE